MSLLEALPRIAFLEAQVIHRAAGAGALQATARDVESLNGMRKGSLGNGVILESRTVSLLYFLIILPRELWAQGPEHEVYARIRDRWDAGTATVLCDPTTRPQRTQFEDNPEFEFVRHLRNAVVHGHFDIEGGQFIFWDHPPKKAVNFKASIAMNSVDRFLNVVGVLLANLGSSPGELLVDSSDPAGVGRHR